MPWGNCLTAAWRKRHQGVLTMVWCFNRPIPHFTVRVEERGVRLDVEAERWDGWAIRFLGDDNLNIPLPECLWYQYRDVEKPLR